jgi:uncharacterized membrane protein YccC
MMAYRAVSIAPARPWARQDLFADLRVRYGIKVGLAGMLALFCTQVLRLPDDNWAILTVLVMMSSQFVGSIAFKGIMRVTGTVAGALVGVWLVSDYTSTPAIFLPVLFLVMAFASYKFGQVGTRQVPYAYFLFGLTTLVIATDGVTGDPTQAWQIGLDRTEEIIVGIICSLLVTTLLWPRYAREEFFEAGRAALKTVNQLFSAHARAYLEAAAAISPEVENIHHAFWQQLSVLKNLQQAGARESTFFAARLSNYNAFLVALSNLFQAVLDLGRHRDEAWFLDSMEPETASFLAAIREEFDFLSAPRAPGEPLRSGRLNEAFRTFEAKVNELRERGLLLAAPVKRALALTGPFAALRSLRDELNNIRSAMEGLPRVGQPLPDAKPHRDVGPAIDWFWVKIGIKGGLAAVVSVVCLKWLHPPGSGSVPLMAWTLTIMARPFLKAGGSGDLRAFQTALGASLFLAVYAVLLLLTTPFLANYAVMNLGLFLVLFAFSFFSARIPGINFWMQIGYLTISAFVGLNPQQPVASQTIIDTSLGLVFGTWIGTVVGRLIWPVLPQRILRDDLVALCIHLQGLLNGDPHQEKIRGQLATLPVEALQTVRQLRMAGCSKEEKARIAALVRALETLIIRISQLVSRRRLLREIAEPRLRLQFECLDVEFKQMVDAFRECFKQGDCRRPLPALQGALAGLDHAVQDVRNRRPFGGEPPEAPSRLLDLVDRYRATAEAMEGCGRLLGSLQLQRYWGDYAL